MTNSPRTQFICPDFSCSEVSAFFDKYAKTPCDSPFDSSFEVVDVDPLNEALKYYQQFISPLAKDLYNFVDFLYSCMLHNYLEHEKLPEEYICEFTALLQQFKDLFLGDVSVVLSALVFADLGFRFNTSKVKVCYRDENVYEFVLSNKGKLVYYSKDKYLSALNHVFGELFNVWYFFYNCNASRRYSGDFSTNLTLYLFDKKGNVEFVGVLPEAYKFKTSKNLMKD